MKHVDVALVGSVWISSNGYQVLNKRVISIKRREVQGSKAIVALGLGVDPLQKIFFFPLLVLAVNAVAVGQNVVAEDLCAPH